MLSLFPLLLALAPLSCALTYRNGVRWQEGDRSLLRAQSVLRAADPVVPGTPYAAALPLALQFFEGQRSGRLIGNKTVLWRGDSGLTDGADVSVRAVPSLSHPCDAPASEETKCASMPLPALLLLLEAPWRRQAPRVK